MGLLGVAGGMISLNYPLATWVKERTWEWHGEMHPLSWLLASWAVGVLIMILLIWALVSLVPLILAIVGAVLGIRWLTRAADRTRSDSAVEALRERYAQGEIGKEEFDARMRDLMQR